MSDWDASATRLRFKFAQVKNGQLVNRIHYIYCTEAYIAVLKAVKNFEVMPGMLTFKKY
jgi:hypothetical protein